MTKQLKSQLFKTAEIVTKLIFLLIFHTLRAIYYKIFGRTLKSVRNEIVLITGGAQGIGRELAFAYSSAGATVVICDVNATVGQKTVQDLAESGHTSVHFFVCDVTNYDDVMSMARKIHEQVGDVTILINNAGIAYINLLLDHKKNEIEKLMNINIMAQYWTIQAFLPAMVRSNKGHIVALASIASIFGLPYSVPYSASKYATRGLMTALYNEYRETNPNIKFTTIFPYFVNTKIVDTNRLVISKFFPVLDTKFVAEKILEAQRKNLAEVSIPKMWRNFYVIFNLLPKAVQDYLFDILKPGLKT